MERKFESKMKRFVLIITLFLISCNSNDDNSFISLKYSFEKWYFKNHPVQSSLKNIKVYDDYFLPNDFKTNERYLLDMKRFYFELTQIDYSNLSKINKIKYDRIKKILNKGIYLIEKVRVQESKPSFMLNKIKFGLTYLINYNPSLKSIQSRLSQVESLLNNSLINITDISDSELRKTFNIIIEILMILENIQLNIDYENDFYDTIVLSADEAVKNLKKYKDNLLSMKSQLKIKPPDINLDNIHFKIITESDFDKDLIFRKAKKSLKEHQNKIFDNSLNLFLQNNDEPVWVDFDDTLNVIKSVLSEIKDENKIDNFIYIENSYKKFGLDAFVDVNFSYYDNSYDYFYLKESLPLILPVRSKNYMSDKLNVNLPKSYFEINIDGKKNISDYNQIQIDLLNAYKFYPGDYYIHKHSNHSLITNKIPNNTTLQGLKRYAERIFIKTNKRASFEHQIMHEKNIITDICKCIVDNELHIKNNDKNTLINFLEDSCFMNESESESVFDVINSNIFGKASINFIGINKILELEKKYIGENKDYLGFYKKYLKNGIVDLENIYQNF